MNRTPYMDRPETLPVIWKTEALEKDCSIERACTLDACAGRFDDLWYRRPRFLRRKMRRLADKWRDEASLHPFEGPRACTLVECAAILTIRSL